jgi:hypothetical protein
MSFKRSQRLVGKGHWKTATSLAALRQTSAVLLLLEGRNDLPFRAPLALHRPVQHAPRDRAARDSRMRLKYREERY